MNAKILIITAALVGGIMLPTRAQSTETENVPANPVIRIQEESLGNVTLDIPDDIIQQILKEDKSDSRKVNRQVNLKPGINKIDGFRIQVFGDGRNQGSLESRARARGNAVAAKFPKYRGQVYSYSSSPNWYTRVGNFRTQAEASAALAELKRAFPQFAGEMRIVKSQIVVIK